MYNMWVCFIWLPMLPGEAESLFHFHVTQNCVVHCVASWWEWVWLIDYVGDRQRPTFT